MGGVKGICGINQDWSRKLDHEEGSWSLNLGKAEVGAAVAAATQIMSLKETMVMLRDMVMMMMLTSGSEL